MIIPVTATERSRPDFYAATPLGLSLSRLRFDSRILTPTVAFDNRPTNAVGLPRIFNQAIQSATTDDILIFTHDDVWIDDYFVVDRLRDGLARYDVIGVAGNRRRLPNQAAWAFSDARADWLRPGFEPTRDRANLSGAVAHGDTPFGQISPYGSCPQDCELLDGVFLAARASVLQQNGVQFYDALRFHFYDLDFCREARNRHLAVGTWPIAITHQSGGGFGSRDWHREMSVYFDKWQT